ncbi:O-antigen acetylase [Planosporangium flavigriseum]|uniref:O-antigen acetylase n=1 Tax=Planosporangium flavigriseum TaxID=373681 RepID=A0A8J3LGN4_9ACTN|nr:O-antigen acetylase [Planosporangium flavigriseum]
MPHLRRRALNTVPLAKAYTGRANSFGFLRLCFAFAVVLAHAAVLGFTQPLTNRFDVPGLAVAGFFGISGFLITRSARRSTLPRYLWHRALRILPGLWGCLLVTGLVLAPSLWYLKHHTLDGLWRSNGGVVDYLRNNWWGGMRQGGILDLLLDTPYGQFTHVALVNGSLWTLSYEIACYLIVAALAALMVLHRARLLVLLSGVLVFGVLVWNHFEQLRFGHAPLWTEGLFGPFPLLGSFAKAWFLWYGFMFLMGAAAELYSDRLPINDLLGVASLAVLAGFVVNGGLFGPGLLFYEYTILWLAVRLPRALHRVGRTNDYSYGVYIYAFPVQQTMAKFGVTVLGLWGFFAVTAAAAFACAYASWHLVEKPALRWRNWTPRSLREPEPGRGEPNPAGSEEGQPEPSRTGPSTSTPAPAPADQTPVASPELAGR